MSMKSDCRSELPLAAVPERLRPEHYPFRVQLRIRWSDVQDGRVSRVGMAHFFEDLRLQVARGMVGAAQVCAEPWDALLRAVTIEHLAPATLAEPTLELAGGIASIGRTSFVYALAAFQQGRCVALGQAVDVCVVDGRAAPFTAEARALLQRGLLPGQPPAPANVPPVTFPTEWAASPWRLELPVRFADTDAVGHLNNVTIFRYHDNAAMAFCLEALAPWCHVPDGPRLAVLRQDVSMDGESFFPEPMGLGLAVAHIGDGCFVLAQATFQKGARTGTARTTVGWCDANGHGLPLPAELRQRLQTFVLGA